MKLQLTANLTAKTARLGNSAWVPPDFSWGETLQIALALEQEVAGTTVVPNLNVTALKAGISVVDARPRDGRWALKIGSGPQTSSNTTETLGYDAAPAQVAAAINALTTVTGTHGTAAVTKESGVWTIIFGAGGALVPLEVVDNTLDPVSFGRIDAVQIDGVWHHDVCLTESPVAFTSSVESVLPGAPTIEQVIAGRGEGTLRWNEVQKLTLDPTFTGTYRLKRFEQYTEPLTRADTSDTLQAALAAAFGANFLVTDGEVGEAFIEFVGELAESPQAELIVEVVTAAKPSLVFDLALDRRELLLALRKEPRLTLPLEVRLQVEDAEEVRRWIVAFRQEVTLLAPVLWPDLASVPGIDFLRPTSPKDYRPFSREAVITGQQFYVDERGNGLSTLFSIEHGLATDYVHVWVREAGTPGTQLVEGTDFRVTVLSADEVQVEALTAPPATDAWLIIVMSAQTVAAFAEGLTVEIGQVNNLEERLQNIEDVLAEYRTLVPTTTPGRTLASTTALNIALPKKQELYPGRFGADVADLLDTITRGRRLLPAVHATDPLGTEEEGFPTVSAAAGQLWENTGETVLTQIPGGLAPGGFFSSDGRGFYRLSRAGTSDSYFPTDLERELWRIEVTPQMLRTGRRLDVNAKLETRAAGAIGDLQAVLAVEWGNVLSQTSPTGAAIDITTTGSGTHTMSSEAGDLGAFTVNVSTNIVTVSGASLSNGTVVTLRTTGALPEGLTVDTSYVIINATGGATCRLTPLLVAPNFEDIAWQTQTPLLSYRMILSTTLQPHPYGVSVIRTVSGITAEQMLYGSVIGLPIAPPLARFALRARLINIDTRNPVTTPRGHIFYTSEGTATI